MGASLRGCLFALAAILAACGGERSAAVTAPRPAPVTTAGTASVAPSVSPVPGASAAPSPSAATSSVPAGSSSAAAEKSAPAPDPKPANAKLSLVLPAKVTIGEPIAIEIVNVDDHDFVFYHPGGSNGCEGFQWAVRLVTPAGTSISDVGPTQACTQALVPPRWVVLPKGQSVRFDQPTDVPFYEVGVVDWNAKPVKLLPGKYAVHVQGGFGKASGSVSLVAAPKQ